MKESVQVVHFRLERGHLSLERCETYRVRFNIVLAKDAFLCTTFARRPPAIALLKCQSPSKAFFLCRYNSPSLSPSDKLYTQL